MRRAVGREAVAGLRLVVHLQAGRFVRVERAVQPKVFVGFEAVVSQNVFKREAGLDLGDFHC